jgi:hypothetical protein
MAAVPVVPAIAIPAGPVSANADKDVLAVIVGVIIRQPIVRPIGIWIVTPRVVIPVRQISNPSEAGPVPAKRIVNVIVTFPAIMMTDMVNVAAELPGSNPGANHLIGHRALDNHIVVVIDHDRRL